MSQDALPVSALLVLADPHLEHEDERKRIANEGMNYAHQQYNCVKMTGYILSLIEKGTYDTPWNRVL